MCQMVVITGRGEEQFIDNTGDLMDALSGGVFMDEGHAAGPGDRRFCLCGVDLIKTCASNGLEYIGNTWAGEWSQWCELRHRPSQTASGS